MRAGSMLIADRSSAMVVRVLEQVAEDPFVAQLVGGDERRHPLVDVDRHVDEPEAGGDPIGELVDVELLEVELAGADVEPRELEQVDHHVVEASYLVDDDVERLLRALRELVPPPVDDLDRRRQRGDRRAQLVAHVGGEAGLALDPVLHRVGHVVERPGEAIEIRIGLGLHPGVESAFGDLTCGVGDPAERSQQPRRLVDHPKNVASAVVPIVPIASAVWIALNVRSAVSRENASK